MGGGEFGVGRGAQAVPPRPQGMRLLRATCHPLCLLPAGTGRQPWGAPPTSGEADAAEQGPECPGVRAGASWAPGLPLTALPKFKPAAAAHSPGPADGPPRLQGGARLSPWHLAPQPSAPPAQGQGHCAVLFPGLAHKVPPHGAAGSGPQGPSCLRPLSRPQTGTVGGGAGGEGSHDPTAALDLHLPRSAASSPADALPLHSTPQSEGLAAETPGPPWGQGAWPGERDSSIRTGPPA